MARWTEDLTLDFAPAEMLLMYISRFDTIVKGSNLLFLKHSNGLRVPDVCVG